jgi:hypothetical protein
MAGKVDVQQAACARRRDFVEAINLHHPRKRMIQYSGA